MFVGKLVQGFCYVCAVALLIAGLVRRAALDLDAGQNFIALLLIFTVVLLLVCLGTLSRLAVDPTPPRSAGDRASPG